MSSISNAHHQSGRGFTIVELMISTTVFSVVLLVLTAGILQMGHVYYKGVTSTQVQTAARSIIDSAEQDIQFSGGMVRTGLSGGGWTGFCIGKRLYQFKQGVELKSGSGDVLTVGTVTGDCSAVGALPVPAASLTENTELLGQSMRVSKLTLTGASGVYTISVRVIAGDDDIICSLSNPGGNRCNSGTPTLVAGEVGRPDLQCRYIRAGTEYCAVSELTVTAQRRVKQP